MAGAFQIVAVFAKFIETKILIHDDKGGIFSHSGETL